MTTLAMPSTLTAIFHSAEPFNERQQALIEGTVQNFAHTAVLDLIETKVREEKFTRAAIARKLNRDPALVTRWLSSPGNWTLQTLGLLMASMGSLPKIGAQSIEELSRSNYYNPAADLAIRKPQPSPKPAQQELKLSIKVDNSASSNQTKIEHHSGNVTFNSKAA